MSRPGFGQFGTHRTN